MNSQSVSVGPFRHFRAITPHDSNFQYANPPEALWVGGAGNIAIEDSEGNATTLAGVQAGSLLPVRAARVNATNTTATLIIGLWLS